MTIVGHVVLQHITVKRLHYFKNSEYVVAAHTHTQTERVGRKGYTHCTNTWHSTVIVFNMASESVQWLDDFSVPSRCL